MSDVDRARRKQLEAILRPRGDSAHLERAIGLAMKYGWSIERASYGDWAANHVSKTIWAHPLATDADFASFLHEAGHAEDPCWSARSRTGQVEKVAAGMIVSLESEAFAWLFAIHHAGWRWNGAMQKELESCLLSYAKDFLETTADVDLFNAVAEHGRERAKGTIRLRPASIPQPIVHLYQQVLETSC